MHACRNNPEISDDARQTLIGELEDAVGRDAVEQADLDVDRAIGVRPGPIRSAVSGSSTPSRSSFETTLGSDFSTCETSVMLVPTTVSRPCTTMATASSHQLPHHLVERVAGEAEGSRTRRACQSRP